MKRVLITGANSYIGESVRKYIESKDETIHIDVLDMVSKEWRNFSFESYDSVFHVAGIAHDTGNKKDAALYYSVNTDLTLEVAKKAKDSGVRQFVFMSSMLVYNGSKERNITSQTLPCVKGCYGDSKLRADIGLREMQDASFNVAVVRPPMIFGPNCKGNFPRLVKMGLKLPVFPKFHNQRSMLFIDNLCEFIYQLLLSGRSGVFFPQNKDYFSTSEIVRIARLEKNKKSRQTIIGNWAIYLLRPLSSTMSKLFGDLTYDKTTDDSGFDYALVDNEESIKRSL